MQYFIIARRLILMTGVISYSLFTAVAAIAQEGPLSPTDWPTWKLPCPVLNSSAWETEPISLDKTHVQNVNGHWEGTYTHTTGAPIRLNDLKVSAQMMYVGHPDNPFMLMCDYGYSPPDTLLTLIYYGPYKAWMSNNAAGLDLMPRSKFEMDGTGWWVRCFTVAGNNPGLSDDSCRLVFKGGIIRRTIDGRLRPLGNVNATGCLTGQSRCIKVRANGLPDPDGQYTAQCRGRFPDYIVPNGWIQPQTITNPRYFRLAQNFSDPWQEHYTPWGFEVPGPSPQQSSKYMWHVRGYIYKNAPKIISPGTPREDYAKPWAWVNVPNLTYDNSANLITNGNFTQGVGTLTDPNQQITGWEITGDTGRLAYGPGNFWTVFNYGNYPPNGTLTQSFNTTKDAQYVLTFDTVGYGIVTNQKLRIQIPRQNGPGFLLDQSVDINTSILSPPHSSPTKSYTFVADSARTTLRFLDTPENNGTSSDILIGRVSVKDGFPRRVREQRYGMTRERTLPAHERAGNPKPIDNYAISYYNPPGAYTIGETFVRTDRGKTTTSDAGVFPIGTLAVKILYTLGTPEWTAENGILAGAPTVQLAVGPNGSLVTAYLMQMDVAIKDPRPNGRPAETNPGWIFGTYVYHQACDRITCGPPGDGWEKMVPLGLMWDNGDWNRGQGRCDTAPDCSTPPVMGTWINPAAPSWAAAKVGVGGRLNGPVDNPRSSCISCHSTAQVPMYAEMVAPRLCRDSSFSYMHWFRNIPGDKAFGIGKADDTTCLTDLTTIEPLQPPPESRDYSLQLAIGAGMETREDCGWINPCQYVPGKIERCFTIPQGENARATEGLIKIER